MTGTQTPRVRWVDALRGVAAISVAWFHLYSQNGGDLVIGHVSGLITHASIVGRYGVELFFVISGFVLALTLLPRQDLRAPKDVGLYFLRRSMRLDPPYLVVLALYVTFYPWFAAAEGSAVDPQMSWPRLLFSIVYFVPRTVELYVPVAWTLGIEVQFYLLFAVLVLAINHLARPIGDRTRATVTVMGAMLALGALPKLGVFADVQEGFWMIRHLSAFAVGATAAMVTMRIAGGKWLFAASLAIVTFGAASGSGRSLAAMIFGLSLIPVIASARLRRLLENPVLLYLGAVSYCVYLLHQLVGGVLVEWVQGWWNAPGYPQLIVIAAGVCATVLAAAVMRVLVEKPAIAWSKKIRFGAPAVSGLASPVAESAS